jgi:uncharacterized protein (TIGR02145 family)
MKKTLFIFLFALFFTACGSDSSISANNSNDDDISSKSSSSVKIASSSSVSSSSSSTKGKGSSSSSAKSSSSIVAKSSCSSVKSSSSSVVIPGSTGNLTDSRDGQTYKTVKTGEQVWMAENLNYETDNSFCYNDNSANCSKYGRLYTWAAAMDSAGTWSTNGKGCGYGKTCSVASTGSATLVRGVCPEGWHLPTQTEWETLFNAVGGQSVAGTKLKSTSGWNSSGNGLDAFSFSALSAGGRYNNGYSDNVGYAAYFWSSTEFNSDDAYVMSLNYGGDGANLSNGDKYNGFSVRCLQD